MKDREISIVDLLVEILLHWRGFVVWMLFGAILFFGVSFIHSRNIAENQQMEMEKLKLQSEELFTEEEMRNVNYVVDYENVCHEKEMYQKEAPMMNIDTNNISKAEATIAIDAEEHQKSCDIEKIYEDMVLSGELIEKVAEDAGIKAIGINEIIIVSGGGRTSEGRIDEKRISGSFMADETNSFRIAVLYNNEAQCKKILEVVIAFLKEKKSDIEDAFGEHEIIVANESFGIVSDKWIAEEQKELLEDIAYMKERIEEIKGELTDTEMQYYNMLTSDKQIEDVVLVEEPAIPSIDIKFILLGAVIAAFIYALVLFIGYIFNTKIHITDNLQELYGIPQLGTILNDKSSKKILGFIDNWFLSLRYRKKRRFTSEEALELASVGIKIAAGKEMLRNICLVGCGLTEQSLVICEKIKTRLAKEGIQVNILKNVLYDAQIMKELENIKGVVLAEEIESAFYNEITEELELLNRQGIKILGGILIDKFEV